MAIFKQPADATICIGDKKILSGIIEDFLVDGQRVMTFMSYDTVLIEAGKRLAEQKGE